jgi:hypothetical protein
LSTTFTGLSKEICQQAWSVMQPSIEALHVSGLSNKFAGTVIVIDPRQIDRPKAEHSIDVFAKAIIFAGHVGDEEDPKYTQIALHKAYQTWKRKMPSSLIQQQHPELYEEGDTTWGGSTITASGLIVAFSGVQQVYDEAISEWVASTIRAICRDEMTKDDGVLANYERDGSFIGGEPALDGDFFALDKIT